VVTRELGIQMRTRSESDEKWNKPVVASDDDSARASLFALLNLVDLTETLALVGSLELLREIVISDAARVHHRVGRENVLYTNELISK
jgi:hypothetical protein